jgi:SAM-dependent methyltransferase
MRSICSDFSAGKFLEIGSGVGNVCGYLQEQGFLNVQGWEINPDALAISRQRFPLVRFTDNNFVTDSICDQFDYIGFFDCLEHVEDDLGCLKLMAAQMHQGSYLVITVPAHMNLWSWHDTVFGHFRRYSKKELEGKVSRAGFNIVKSQYFMGVLAPILLLRKIWGAKKAVTERDIEARYRAESGVSSSLLNSIALMFLRFEAKVLKFADVGVGASLFLIAKKN